MSGRHAKPPSPVPASLTRAAARALPGIMAAGTVAGVAVSGSASAQVTQPAGSEHTRAVSHAPAPVVRKAPARVKDPLYKVRSGDSLSAIAQRLCHKAADWTGIYKKNRKTIGADPDLIIPGQALRIACLQAAIAAGSGPVTTVRKVTGTGYAWPFRHVAGLIWERIDEGVDFAGTGPVYALGPGVVTFSSSAVGWPGGHFIAYRLTHGFLAGHYIYVAEDIIPSVSVGDHVNSGTVIGHMYNGGSGIETGFALPPGNTDTPAAYGHYTEGVPTPEGTTFHAALRAVERGHHQVLAGVGAGRDGDHDGDEGTARTHHHAHVSGVVSLNSLSSFGQCVAWRESGDNPRAYNGSSGASGLFGFLPSTWDSLGLGYPGGAYTAPVATQIEGFLKLFARDGTAPWAPYDGC